MAVQGLLGPDGKSAPILTGLRCVYFHPPRFTLGKKKCLICHFIKYVSCLTLVSSAFLEVQCLNETQKYLRKVVHEVGLELRSTAVCKGVRRTRDGHFTLQDALTRQHWTAADVMQAIYNYHASKKKKKCLPLLIEKPSLETSGEKLTATE